MSKSSPNMNVISKVFAPLKAWSGQPPIPLEDIGTMLHRDSNVTLGFWSRVGLNATLFFRNALWLPLAFEGAVISMVAVFVLFATQTNQLNPTPITSRPKTGVEKQVEVQSTRIGIAPALHTDQTPNWGETKTSIGSLAPTRKQPNAQARLSYQNVASWDTVTIGSNRDASPTEETASFSLPQPRNAERREDNDAKLVSPIVRIPNYHSPQRGANEHSGISIGVGSHFTAIPSENNIAGRSLSELDMRIGYRFNNFHQIAFEYSAQTFRRFNETSHMIVVTNFSTGQKSYVRTASYQAVDELLKVPGVAYTFSAYSLKTFGLVPALTGFAGGTSAGFLWRAGVELAVEPMDHLNATLSYKFEKLNSVDFSPVQSQRTMLGLALEYRW